MTKLPFAPYSGHNYNLIELAPIWAYFAGAFRTNRAPKRQPSPFGPNPLLPVFGPSVAAFGFEAIGRRT
jgi:hypothetical protein